MKGYIGAHTGSILPVVSGLLDCGKTDWLAAHIQVDGTVRLYLTEDPSTVTWKSDNEAIATVDETGMVTGKKKGLVAITAALDGKKYELYVRVAEK